MDDGMKPFEPVLRDVGRKSDEETQASARIVARSAASKAVARWESRRAGLSRWARPAVALVAAAAITVGLYVGIARDQGSGDALSFVMGATGEPGKVGAWMASPPEGLPLRFSEGSQIVLQPGASARVTHADTHGADLLLERGALRASVVHRDSATGWMVHAGPFEIHVVGTSFETAWDPAEGALDVNVVEGRVMVTGPLLDAGHAVQAEEHLRVSLKSSRFEMTKVGTPFTVPSESPKPPDEPSMPERPAPSVAIAPAPSSDPSAATPSTASAVTSAAAPHATASSSAIASNGWRDLARAGQHKAALDAAMALGFGRVLSESSASDLMLLADSARYAGDVAHAKQALVAARGRGDRGRSAFLLGKIAADSSGAPGEAAQWFETYLAEAPGGGLAEQALGRLIELYRRTGRAGSAQSAATKYLQKYPSGGYAGAARSALGQ